MDKLIIINWLLTRRCNLKCSYCGIVREPKQKEYKNLKYYIENEMPTKYVIDVLGRIKKHNPDAFHIFYGGEPLLREDLPEIINFCNKNNINYTIITNNSDEVQPALKNLFEKTDYIQGLTSSVDPIIFSEKNKSGDRYKKSKLGLERLISLKGKVKDLVAEITIDNNNIDYIIPLVKILDENGISSSITFIDIAKNSYYDFSSISDEKLLVFPTEKNIKILNELMSGDYNIHLSDVLLKKIIDILPSNLDCKLLDSFHNLTIDADGNVRLCLRIKGISSNQNIAKVTRFIDENGKVDWHQLKSTLRLDKIFPCEGCNWTCPIMSKLVLDNEIYKSGLLHSDKRGD